VWDDTKAAFEYFIETIRLRTARMRYARCDTDQMQSIERRAQDI
jgi:hypothetical protein